MSFVCRETLISRAGLALACAGILLPVAALAQDPAAPAGETPPPAESGPVEAAPAESAPTSSASSDAPASQDAAAASAPAPETVPTIPVNDGAPAVAPKKDSTELDTVVVTARKRVETLQEVPMSVTAFSQRDMERRGFSGLEDIARATAGFTFEPYMTGGAHAAPVIRGLAQTFTTARIQNVSFFLDGVYLQRQSMLDLGMVDMERIEVMKGPQNALYGRNAFAGAVNYITMEPGATREGYLMMGVGDNTRRDYRVSVTGPLNEEGNLLAKFTGGLSTYRGAAANNHPVADADPPGENLRGNLGGHDDKTYAFSLVYEPIDGLRLRGNYYYSDLIHETSPGYSISGVHSGRFNLRLDTQNDLNCLPATINDIGNPSPTAQHTGNSAWCGELPAYASDVAGRKTRGMVVDPRAIGTTTKTGLATFSAEYPITDALNVHYTFGLANHHSYTDGGASDEDPTFGRGLNADSTKDNQDATAYYYVNTSSGRPNSELREISHELRFDWKFDDRLRTGFGAYHSAVKDAEWTSLFISDLCNADPGPGQYGAETNRDHCNEPISAPNHFAEYVTSNNLITSAAAWDQAVRQSGGRNRGEWTAFDDQISAAFGSASYKVTDDIEATLEARYSKEDKAIDRLTDPFMLAPGETVDYSTNPNILPAGNKLTSSITPANAHDSASFTDVAPRAIVNWDWDEGHMVYGSVAKGVKAGGFNNSATPAEQKYAPETNWTWELGSKNAFWHHAFILNASAYYIKWTALQGSTPPAVSGFSSSDIVSNIGGATSMGAEIESVFHVTRTFFFDASLSYSDPKYDDGVVYTAARAAGADNSAEATRKIWCDGVRCKRNGDVGGNQLARTSKQKYSLGVNYSHDLFDWGLTGRLDTNYQSKQYIEPVNLSWVPARLITNASVKVNPPDFHWEVDTWVKNLTNEDYAANSFYIGVFDQYMVGKGTPRTFGATVKYKF